MTTPNEQKFRNIFAGSLILSIVLSFALVVPHEPLWSTVVIVLTLIVVSTWRILPRLYKKKRSVTWPLTLAALNLLVLAPELALRVMNFSYESGIQFGYPRPEEMVRFVPDERLLWKLSPADPGVNSLGFPGKEIVIPKPKGQFRALFLGDSCTQQGYPDLVESFLNADPSKGAMRFESITLAIAGYSSYQGYVLSKMYGLSLDPNLALIYYGWNDHWQAYRSIDSEKIIRSPQIRDRMGDSIYRTSRILQAVNKVFLSLWATAFNEPTDELRVPPEQYRENLVKISEIFRGEHIPVIMITAPTAHYRLEPPDYLVDLGFAPDKPFAITVHKRYNEIARDIAEHQGLFLLDLEAELDSFGNLEEIFMTDGMHFTMRGSAVVAKRLSDFIQEHDLFREPRSGAPGG